MSDIIRKGINSLPQMFKMHTYREISIFYLLMKTLLSYPRKSSKNFGPELGPNFKLVK